MAPDFRGRCFLDGSGVPRRALSNLPVFTRDPPRRPAALDSARMRFRSACGRGSSDAKWGRRRRGVSPGCCGRSSKIVKGYYTSNGAVFYQGPRCRAKQPGFPRTLVSALPAIGRGFKDSSFLLRAAEVVPQGALPAQEERLSKARAHYGSLVTTFLALHWRSVFA
jgi:hypothetical protein